MTALGGNQHHALGGTATIEHHCLCAFQEGNVFYLVGFHIVGSTGHAIDHHQQAVGRIVGVIVGRTLKTPHAVAVETSHIALHVVKTISIVVLLHQFSVVERRDSTVQVFLRHLSESHVHLSRVCHVNLGGSRQGCCQAERQRDIFYYLFHNSFSFFTFLLFYFLKVYHPGFCG